LEFLNTEIPVLKIATGFESPNKTIVWFDYFFSQMKDEGSKEEISGE
jgi:hypothetical protein